MTQLNFLFSFQTPPAIPKRFSDNFRDFLQRCFDDNCDFRPSADQLLKHPVFGPVPFNSSVFYAPPPPPQRTRKESDMIPAEDPQSDEASSVSRFVTDYESLALIGKGGFGKVYKARNLVDNNLYALKQVCLSSRRSSCTNEVQRILREVQYLSSLNHEHVVRYYTSWIEESLVQDDSDGSDADTTEYTSEGDLNSKPRAEITRTHSKEIRGEF